MRRCEGRTDMKVNELFFELSHENRLEILRLLGKARLKNKQIAEELATSHTETVRHLVRLGEAGLIEKDAEGWYRLSPLGSSVLELVSGFDFASEKDSFLKDHVLNLPPPFLRRIGELSGCEVIRDVMTTLRKSTEIIERATTYVWFMADQINVQNIPLLKEKMGEGLEFRFIQKKDYVPPPGFEWSDEPFPLVRFVSEWPLNVYLSDTEGMLRFCSKDKKIDYTSCLYSQKKEFHSFCADLYLHFWQGVEGKP